MSRDYFVRTEPDGEKIPSLDNDVWVTGPSNASLPTFQHTYETQDTNGNPMTNSTVQTLISSENLSQQESYIASNNIPTSNLFNTVYITNRLDGAPSILSATLNQASVQGIVLDLTDPQFVLQFSNTNINLTVDSTLYYPYGLRQHVGPKAVKATVTSILLPEISVGLFVISN